MSSRPPRRALQGAPVRLVLPVVAVAATLACAPIRIDYRTLSGGSDGAVDPLDTDPTDTDTDTSRDTAPADDTGVLALAPDTAAGDTDGLPVLFHALHRAPGGVTSRVGFTACGMAPESATSASRVVSLAVDEATDRAWGTTAAGELVAIDPATLAPVVRSGAPAALGPVTWDPVRGVVVGVDPTGDGTFVLFEPVTGDWRAVGDLQGVDPTAITHDPVHGGFVVLAGPGDLLVYDADLHLQARTTTQGAPTADGTLDLAASSTGIWAIFHPSPLTLVSFERRQYRVDPATGAFTEERCAHWVSPQPLHPRRRGTALTTAPPPGTTDMVVGTTLSEVDACGPRATLRALATARRAALDPSTGDVYTAGRELVRSPRTGPDETVPQDLALPPLSATPGLTWGDERVWLLAGAGDGYLFDWSSSGGWHVHGTLQGLGLGAATFDPASGHLLAIGEPGLLWVLTPDGGALHALSIPTSIRRETTQLRPLGDGILAWTDDGRRLRIDPATGETARIRCP